MEEGEGYEIETELAMTKCEIKKKILFKVCMQEKTDNHSGVLLTTYSVTTYYAPGPRRARRGGPGQ